MFERVAEAYDVLHAARGKDYAAESRRVIEAIRRRKPDARTLLDAACGSGRHLAHLRDEFEVQGLDASADMLAAARLVAPDVPLHQDDLRTFELPEPVDAVTCLFSSIGYLHPLEEMRRGVANLVRHLVPGGVLVLEPWFAPDEWRDGHVMADSGGRDDVAVARAIRSWRSGDGHTSHMEMRWLVATAERIDLVVEQHDMGLYTVEQYTAALVDAGCDVDHDPEGLIGRGLYVAVRRSVG